MIICVGSKKVFAGVTYMVRWEVRVGELLASAVYGVVLLVILYVAIIMLLDGAGVRYEVHRCGCARVEQNYDDDEYWCREWLCARHVTGVLGGPHIQHARVILTSTGKMYHGEND